MVTFYQLCYHLHYAIMWPFCNREIAGHDIECHTQMSRKAGTTLCLFNSFGHKTDHKVGKGRLGKCMVGKNTMVCLVAFKKAVLVKWLRSAMHLGPLTTDSSCQLDILWHDCDSLGMNGAQVGIFK